MKRRPASLRANAVATLEEYESAQTMRSGPRSYQPHKYSRAVGSRKLFRSKIGLLVGGGGENARLHRQSPPATRSVLNFAPVLRFAIDGDVHWEPAGCSVATLPVQSRDGFVNADCVTRCDPG